MRIDIKCLYCSKVFTFADIEYLNTHEANHRGDNQ